MFIAIYTVCLALGAGLAGAFGHAVLAEQGFISSFQSAALATAGIAAAYACAQLAYMALLNFVAPSRGGASLLSEAASNAAAVVLLPFLVRIPLPWPHPKIAELELFLLPAAFLGIHVALKLFSLFAVLHSRHATRAVALIWAAAAVACGMASAETLRQFVADLTTTRSVSLPEPELHVVNQTYATARAIREGTLFRIPLEGQTGKAIVLHVAFPKEETNLPERLHFVVDVGGGNTRPYTQSLTLSVTGWTTLQIPPQEIPGDATHCDVIWMREAEPAWMTRTRIRPASYGSSELLIAGPHFTPRRTPETPKSIVLIMADGLAARHTTLNGYTRDTTPKLLAWSQGAARFATCMTPAPEAPSALMSALTARSPLRHGFLNGVPGPLPEDAATLAATLTQQGYICAAFTEGESAVGVAAAHSDVVHGSGFERGIHLFDQGYPMSPATQVDGQVLPGAFVPSGAAVTLDRAKEFIAAHRDVPFLAIIRLRELSAPRIPLGVTPAFGEGTPADLYDSALLRFDDTLGGFLDWLDQTVPATGSCIAVTASHGYDYANARPGEWPVYLNEPSLHVPLLIRAPGIEARQQNIPCGLEDLAPTLITAAGIPATNWTGGGNNLLGSASPREPISMTGNPIALSLRTKHWRFTWQSGQDPVTRQPTTQESFIEFISIADYDKGIKPLEAWSREKELAERYRQRLAEYLQAQK